MRSYLSLIPISVRVRRKQSLMTVICITLSVFLVTAIFSMADMGIRLEEANAKQKHGSWHILIRDISDEEAEEISARPDVAAFSVQDAINYNIKEDYYIGGKKAAVAGMNKTFLTDTFDYITEGRFPETDNEAVISENAKDIMGVNIGDSITLNTPLGKYEYTISGFEHDANTYMYDAVLLCLNMSAFDNVRISEGKSPAREYCYRFNKYINVRKSINEIKEQFNIPDENIGENVVMVGLTGFSENSVLQGMYITAGVLSLLILIAGVLMIAGSMNSNITQRTEFFGMLRCIGASKKQIIRFVRLEALNWCKIAVPIGSGLGIIVTWILCAALKFGIGGELSSIPLFGISLTGIVCGIFVGIITVLIAARSPAKKASKVSPVTAVSGNVKVKTHRSISAKFLKTETALGISHASASKKNLLLMTGSFALSIILFLSFSAIHDWTRHALNDLQPHTPDLSFASADLSCNITGELADNVNSMRGVKRAFGRGFKGDLAIDDYKGINKVDLVSLDDIQFEWADEEKWTKDSVGLERAYKEKNCVITVFDKDNPLEKGDKIKLGDDIAEIVCVFTDSPIGGGGNPTILCNEKMFARLTGETGYAVLDIQLEKNATESNISAIRSQAEANGFLLSDRRENNREIEGTYYAFTILVYGFIGIIAMIALFNIMNSISMSVSARIKQYGAMRSVGMSARQLTDMIAAETAVYTFCGLVVGLVAGIPINKLFFESFVTAYFGTAWEPPLAEVFISAVFVLIASILAVYAPSNRIKNMSVADTARSE